MSIPPTKAKLKLLEAAERLIAERGFDAVSVRDVTQAAKANVAAVNYHFGSREGMMGLVVSRYLEPVNDDRLMRLGVLEKKWGSKGVPVEELVEAFVRPLVGVAAHGGVFEPWQRRLVGRILSLGEYPQPLGTAVQDLMERFAKAFGKSLSAVSKEELWWRLHFMTGGLVHLLTHGDGLEGLSGGASGRPAIDLSMVRFMHYAVAGLREGMPVEKRAAKASPQATFDF